jgi:hypothetical protein
MTCWRMLFGKWWISVPHPLFFYEAEERRKKLPVMSTISIPVYE